MQTVKTFIFGKDRLTPAYNTDPLDDQINAFLAEHPHYTIASVSTIVGAGFQEAFVVFNIPEVKPQTEKPEWTNENDHKYSPGQGQKHKGNKNGSQN